MDPPPDEIARELGVHRPSQTAPSPTSGHKSSPGPGLNPKIRRRNRLITSCLECRRRKLKCDKQHPCTNCTKFNRDCVFLAPALDQASQQKLAEIKEKMGSLERTLEEDVAKKPKHGRKSLSHPLVSLPGQGDGDTSDEQSAPEDEVDLEPSPLATEDAAYYDDADDELMDLGVQLGKMRITERIGGFVRPKFAEELANALREVPPTNTPPVQPNLSSGPNAEPYLGASTQFIAPASSLFFPSDPRKVSILNYLPSRNVADNLIARYWIAVHPMIRVVHRPSFERKYELFWKDVVAGTHPPNSFQALVLAAMLSAVLSLPEEDVLSQFGVAKTDLVANFMRGSEAALSRANFLRTTKLETLQAFVAYLVPLCRSEISRAHSALTGTAIRLAECMGLHRDGSHYGLKPVEVHVRRLIWYQLCFLDIRTCEATGPRPQIRREDFDTQFPLNVDDVDLESPNPPMKDKDCWTDMTFARMRFECNEMHRLLWVERPRLERKQTTLTGILGKIQKFFTSMEKKYIPMLDKNNRFHQFAAITYKVLSYRMHVMVLQRYNSSSRRLMPERLRQILLTSGVAQLENAIRIETTPAFSAWAWYAGAFQQYHTALLVLSELYATPNHYHEDRAWGALDYVFELPADMHRADKSRYIITELRDRTIVYQSYRKMRAPVAMREVHPRPVVRPLNMTSRDQSVSSPSPSASGRDIRENTSPETSAAGYFGSPPGLSAAEAQDWSWNGAGNGEALYAPGSMLSPPMLHSDTSSSGLETGQPSSVSGDVMLDIDWNEWDKLFPPNMSNQDLDVPDFGFQTAYHQF